MDIMGVRTSKMDVYIFLLCKCTYQMVGVYKHTLSLDLIKRIIMVVLHPLSDRTVL